MKKSIKIFNIILWIAIFLVIFYRGSVNVGIWGEWQGFEIVMPIIISVFISGIIMLVVFFLEHLLGLHKEGENK